MIAAYATRADAEVPLDALVVGEIEPPSVPSGWVRVHVKAAALNHHDVWSLRGVGLPADRLPMILGCDAAGVSDDGREVIVHAVINSPDFVGSDATYDPERSLLSERYPGTFGQAVRVELRRGGLPANGLADRVPDALQPVRSPAGRYRADPGCRWGSVHRAHRAWPAGRAAGLGDLA